MAETSGYNAGYESPESAPQKRKYSTVELGDNGTHDLDSLSSENQALAEFGYKPVFKRDFGFFATFSFAASISACFATIVTTYSYPLAAGGAASAVWCWLISGAGCMTIAASVAELVSAYPTSGGLYFTVSRLAPPEWVASISWITGWLNLLGQIAGVSSTEYGSAAIILAVASIGSNGAYIPTNSHTVGVQAALTVFHGAVNSMSTAWLAKITTSYVVFHMLAMLTCSIALLAMCPDRNSASYIFTNVTADSGWSPVGFSFLFGFLSVSWTMTDYDATAHITEEIDEPEVKAPWAIFLAMALTYVAGWLFTITLAATMGPDPDALFTDLAQPVVQLFYNVLGRDGAMVFGVCAFIILNTCTITALHSTARTFFAFSRDKLIPGSNIWKKINQRTGTPIYAVWLTVILCASLNLIALGSYITISAIFNVCAIALDWSYCIPIVCKMFSSRFKRGPWHMGKASWYINAYAVIWTAFVSVIFLFPTVYPVTADNMNYAVVILAAIFVAAGIYWAISGRKFYTGPIAETQIIPGERPLKSEREYVPPSEVIV